MVGQWGHGELVGRGSGAVQVVGSLELHVDLINENPEQEAAAGSSGGGRTVVEGLEEVVGRTEQQQRRMRSDGVNG